MNRDIDVEAIRRDVARRVARGEGPRRRAASLALEHQTALAVTERQRELDARRRMEARTYDYYGESFVPSWDEVFIGPADPDRLNPNNRVELWFDPDPRGAARERSRRGGRP